MSQHPYAPMSIEGSRALQRRSSHDDREPGLEMMRWGSILGGSALAAWGLLRKGRFTGMFLAGIGAAIAYRGIAESGLMDRPVKRIAMHTKATTPVELAASMTIERPIDEVYEFWEDFENLPRVLRHIESVEMLDDNRSRWVAQLPGGMELTWRARLLEDRKNELIAWQSMEGTDIYNEGYITFHPVYDGEATEIHVRIIYRPPAGEIGAKIAGFFNNLQQQVIREDLRTFKQIMETGEVPTVHGQPSARAERGNGRIGRLM